MNTQRLQQLADFLKTVPTEKFNLAQWRQIRAGRITATDDQLKSNCNTQACAIGWACLMPEFQKEGLKFAPADYAYSSGYPVYNNFINWRAVQAFFDLSFSQAQFLFSSDFYPVSANPKHVIDRINFIIQNGFLKQVFEYMNGDYYEL